MKKLTIVILTLVSFNAFACNGPAADRFQQYWKLSSTTDKTIFLIRNSCTYPVEYNPRKADPVIMKVLVDAIEGGIDTKVINKVVKNYNCVHGARNLPGYATVKRYIAREIYGEYCTNEKFENLYIVKAKGGAILRNGAGTKNDRIGLIAEGSTVKVFTLAGDFPPNWAYVKSKQGEGFVYEPLLEPY